MKQPRFDQIYNQERNLYSCGRFTELGIPTVPFLFHRTVAGLEATMSWLGAHPEVEVVAVLAQFYRRLVDFERLLESMERLRREAGRELRFLVVGCSTAVKIERLFARRDRVRHRAAPRSGGLPTGTFLAAPLDPVARPRGGDRHRWRKEPRT